ncbi:peptide IlvX [Pseudescherichia sp.]|nr:peptide IlvX [Pseudescherichia sp.]
MSRSTKFCFSRFTTGN